VAEIQQACISKRNRALIVQELLLSFPKKEMVKTLVKCWFVPGLGFFFQSRETSGRNQDWRWWASCCPRFFWCLCGKIKSFLNQQDLCTREEKKLLLGRMTSGATSTEGTSTATSVAGPGSADGGSINTASSPNKNPEAKIGAGDDQSSKDLAAISSLVKDPEAISFLAMEFEKVKNGEASSIQVGSRSKSFSSKTILTVSPPSPSCNLMRLFCARLRPARAGKAEKRPSHHTESRARLVCATPRPSTFAPEAWKKTGHRRSKNISSWSSDSPSSPQEDVAVEIYLVGVVGKGKEPGAIEVGAHYGISAKAVRDIW